MTEDPRRLSIRPWEEAQWVPRPLRVPTEHGAVLAVPSLDEARRAAQATRQRLDESGVNVQGRTLSQLRDWSRRDCLQAAAEYTNALTGSERAAPDSPPAVFVAGHQPTLFHPGVWVKNFAIGHLAAGTGGLGLNLVVDNDVLSTTAIRVPAGSLEHPRLESVEFDSPHPPQPWEDAGVLDRTLFRSFGERVSAVLHAWGVQPLIDEFWPAAVAHLARSDRLADCLTAARHAQERRWGLDSLELPVSRMCTQRPFLWFASHLLAHLPRFREIHNNVLAQYRRVNRVRSRSHPVPELVERDGWLEAPFWIWRTGDQRRRHVVARREGRELQLSNGDDVFATLKLSPDMDACCAVEALQELPSRGLHFRTRALTTTLFARLCLGDLFIHGIGGAKYDEMTDRIIARFFGLEPPPFMTLTATLHLPLGQTPTASREDLLRLRHQLRDVQHNADRHRLPTEAAELIESKRALIADQHAARTQGLSSRERRARRAANRERYAQLRDVNSRLATAAGQQKQAIEAAVARAEQQWAASTVLRNREYAFVLYPADQLLGLMRRLEATQSLHHGA